MFSKPGRQVNKSLQRWQERKVIFDEIEKTSPPPKRLLLSSVPTKRTTAEAFFAPQHPAEPAEKRRKLSPDTFLALNLQDIVNEHKPRMRAAVEGRDEEMTDA